MQSEVAYLLTDTCIVNRAIRDASGNIISYAEFGEFDCRLLVERGPQEGPEIGRIRVVTYFRLVIPPTLDIEDTDEIIIDGITYQPTGNNYPATDLVIRIIDLIKVEP